MPLADDIYIAYFFNLKCLLSDTISRRWAVSPLVHGITLTNGDLLSIGRLRKNLGEN